MATLFEQFDNVETRAQTKNNEWFTPARYVDAAREVMGRIDLDPASCELANRTVKATRYYTKEENGLMHPWYGRVWLNPPYLRIEGGLSDFVRKLVNEYQSGNIEQAVMLTTAQVDSTWFQLLWNYPICFTNHRVHFHRLIDGRLMKESRHGHLLGTALVYFGPNEQAFSEHFCLFGRIVKAIDTPKPKPIMRTLWETDG